MRNLLNFLIRYTSWFVFAFYVVLSCVLLFQGNPYQHHVYLTSANAVVSGVYDATNSVTGYINLRSINEDLQRRTATLEQEVLDLRHQNKLLHQQLLQDSLRSLDSLGRFGFVIASVVNNSVRNPYNYITIDKGEADGIGPEMESDFYCLVQFFSVKAADLAPAFVIQDRFCFHSPSINFPILIFVYFDPCA